MKVISEIMHLAGIVLIIYSLTGLAQQNHVRHQERKP